MDALVHESLVARPNVKQLDHIANRGRVESAKFFEYVVDVFHSSGLTVKIGEAMRLAEALTIYFLKAFTTALLSKSPKPAVTSSSSSVACNFDSGTLAS